MSQPVGEIKVRRGLETYGGKGESLVKGVVVNLSAIALSVKPGGSIERVQILGGLVTLDPALKRSNKAAEAKKVVAVALATQRLVE